MKKKPFFPYYTDMINKSYGSYHKLGVYVDRILEIRLSPETWEKVKKIADAKKCSYSWVVRYCVFRLIKRKNPFMYITNHVLKQGKRKKWLKYQTMNERAKQQVGIDHLHRHKLCLYGTDELFIRITANMMYCTMSHLVRLALEWHLGELERLSSGKPGKFHRLAFYWLGIKLFRGVVLPTLLPENVRLLLDRFQETEYW
ncbi:MAG: hypothetical protein ABUK01_05160 [Leptospirales bacterium]